MSQTTRIYHALSAIRLAAGDGKWVLGGSAGLLLRDLRLASPPRDIDLYCDEEDQPGIHNALNEYATDEPVFSETSIYGSILSHYQIGEYRVELVGGFQVRSLGSCYSVDVKSVLHPYGDRIKLVGSEISVETVHVAPLAHELVFNALRERDDRVRLIAEAMASNKAAHSAALAVIEARNEISPQVMGRLKTWLEEPEEGDRDGR